jgi:hypothetical protein
MTGALEQAGGPHDWAAATGRGLETGR